MGLLGGSVGKESACNARDAGDRGSVPGLGRSPLRGHGNPPPVFLPGESQGPRSLVGYSPSGHKESNMTEATEPAHPSSMLGTGNLA